MPCAKTAAARPRDPEHNWCDEPLEQRPGFLIRRLHQIHTALFAEETQPEKVTPIMVSVLFALDQCEPVDQTTLARTVAIDKTNMAEILERLRKRGLISRRVAPNDQRVRLASLTDDGRALLNRVSAGVDRAHARTVEALTPAEREQFLALMIRLVEARESGDDSKSPGDVTAPNNGLAS